MNSRYGDVGDAMNSIMSGIEGLNLEELDPSLGIISTILPNL